MEPSRICKHVFLWDYNIQNSNWTYFVSTIFADGSSLWITGWCCHKMAKGGNFEPWKWHVLVHLL